MKCIVMIGLPACGKSTHIQKIKTEDTWIYSTDMYIDAVAEDHGLTYAEVFESNIKAATRFNEEKVDTMFKLKRPIIWDQTNLGAGKRKKIINRAKNAGYYVQGICLLPPESNSDYAAWQKRLISRPGKVIPNTVITNMMENFTIPTLEEGFDSITFCDIWGNVMEVQK